MGGIHVGSLPPLVLEFGRQYCNTMMISRGVHNLKWEMMNGSNFGKIVVLGGSGP